jgi:dihydroflavonol-4-reductase
MTATQIPAGTTVLVTGATGFTGANLTRRLVQDGLRVRALARETSNIEPLEDLDVEWLRGDVYDPALVAEAMRDVEYVFHLAACFRDPKAASDEYGKVHVDSTKLLAQQAVRNRNFKRFVHTSTMGVHGHIENPPGSEESPYSPGDLYQQTKLEAELWLREFSAQQGLPFTVVRPTAIFGPGDRRLLKLFKFAKRGWCPLISNHDTLYHLIHVDDLTSFYVHVATHPAALGEVFLCGNETYTSLRAIIDLLGDFFDTRPKYVSLPRGPMFMLADASEWVSAKLGVSPILYRRRLAFFTKDRAFDTDKSRRLLGFECKYDNESGLLDTARAYRAAGWI